MRAARPPGGLPGDAGGEPALPGRGARKAAGDRGRTPRRRWRQPLGAAGPAATRSPPPRSAATSSPASASTPAAAPSSRTMAAWAESPYRAIGVYIGGDNRGCSQPNLTASWVSAQTAAGWHLIPTYVGLQAPTSELQQLRQAQRQPRRPRRATKRRSDAVAEAATRRRWAPAARSTSTWSPTRATSSATAATLAFLEAWTEKLHALGYVSGVYSSGASGIADLAAQLGTGYSLPDDLWFANWNGQATTTDPYVPDQRLDPAPAHPPVPRRPRRDLRRGDDQHRQRLRRRRRRSAPRRPSRASEDPVGSLDLIGAPTPGQVRVKGWAFDPNAPTEPLAIRAYVGGRPGAARRRRLRPRRRSPTRRASTSAPSTAGAGANHGFDVTFPTLKSGPQPVCVYALNTGGGADRLLGCKSTTIPVAVTLSALKATRPASRSGVTCEWPAGHGLPRPAQPPHPGQGRPAAPPRHAAADPRRHPLARAPRPSSSPASTATAS